MSVLVLERVRGSFSLDKVGPEAIQPGNRSVAVVTFNGSVPNGGTGSGRATVLMGLTIGGRSHSEAAGTGLISFPPGVTPVTLSIGLTANDGPGDIVARVVLIDEAGTTLAQITSGVLGFIEAEPAPEPEPEPTPIPSPRFSIGDIVWLDGLGPSQTFQVLDRQFDGILAGVWAYFIASTTGGGGFWNQEDNMNLA